MATTHLYFEWRRVKESNPYPLGYPGFQDQLPAIQRHPPTRLSVRMPRLSFLWRRMWSGRQDSNLRSPHSKCGGNGQTSPRPDWAVGEMGTGRAGFPWRDIYPAIKWLSIHRNWCAAQKSCDPYRPKRPTKQRQAERCRAATVDQENQHGHCAVKYLEYRPKCCHGWLTSSVVT